MLQLLYWGDFMLNLANITVIAKTDTELKAAAILADEISARCGAVPAVSDEAAGKYIAICIEDESDSEEFTLKCAEDGVTVKAHRLRGLIYGIFYILRKCDYNGYFALTEDISGTYSPDIKTRGVNLCYDISNNTCDAWDRAQYRRYMLDMMAFGINTVEDAFSFRHEMNGLMKMTLSEALHTMSELCAELDLNFTVYYPLDKKFTDEETVQAIVNQLGGLPKLDNLFLPGGDPGNLQAEDFVRRCKAIKKALAAIYPNLRLIPTAQAPHEYPDWGERFKKAMADSPEEVDAVIYGPNHAMPLDELRRSIDIKCPIEQYADITHNVRCETPVHFTRDDWHYAWASTLSRESVNPRPREYRLLHHLTRQYLDGNTPYSEGVNDDVNKCVFASLDFDFNCSVREVLKDYARLFIPEAAPEKICDIIFGLEQNWEAAPEESFSVEAVFNAADGLLKAVPKLKKNWRFMLVYFRALCDKIVRDRRLFELELIKKADFLIRRGDMNEAQSVLGTEFREDYKANRKLLFGVAKILFDLIGIQLDVEHFGGKNPERGCTLDTVDMPVTDRQYLLNRIRENSDREYMLGVLDRTKVNKNEYYFSFAEHGFEVCGRQHGEYYYNFRGDQNKDASRPMAALNGYDHFEFRTNIAGLTGGDYILRINYADTDDNEGTHLKITANGNTVYEGERFGGVRDTEYENKYLSAAYRSVCYEIPAEFIENGCVEFKMTEPLDGFIMYEYILTVK